MGAHFKAWFCAVLSAVIAVVTATATPALADPTFAQPTYNRQDIGPLYLKYSTFAPGVGDCVWCPRPYGVGRGTMKTFVKTWKVADQNNRYDYYFVSVKMVNRNKSGGSRDWGWTRVRIENTTAVDYASYSSGISEDRDGCFDVDVKLGVDYYGLSAGTDIGTLSTCARATVSRTAVTRGQSYFTSRYHAVSAIEYYRFIRVGQGVHKKFKVQITRPTDSCTAVTVPDGTHYNCYNGEATKTVYIGTRRQQ